MFNTDKTIIIPNIKQERWIYAYTLPEVRNREKYLKIGDTTKYPVNLRIKEQIGTSGLTEDVRFERVAKKIDGSYFRDHDLHNFLEKNGIERVDFNGIANEWFYFNGHPEKAEILTDQFINMDYLDVQVSDEKISYTLRKEQNDAVEKTLKYFNSSKDDKKEFLWNAKPRFGKTLTTYDLILRMEVRNILIITNRPAIANSWYDDFVKFIAHKEPKYLFVSESDSISKKGPITRQEFHDALHLKDKSMRPFGSINFYSLQDLKGAKWANGQYDKHRDVLNTNWDIIVIDEAHEGVDTLKTDKLFEKLNSKYILHLSGTPFKALNDNKFTSEQIFNWSYADEQEAKYNWNPELDSNPYENLPTLSLFTYQMSNIIQNQLSGDNLDVKNNLDYAFDLNEFFKTKDNGKFEYEESVKLFLDNICQGKFPFAKDEYKHKLNHTLWLLNRVASVEALAELLKDHEIFKDYQIIIAAGNNRKNDSNEEEFNNEAIDQKSNEKSLTKVRNAIEKFDKTITLSVGQLTTGVTIPEWTGVMMLSNIKSPSLYFQAAFRAQNPYEFVDENGDLYVKENAYIFDFAPERTLIQFDNFANNLKSDNISTSVDRHKNIKELLNFFPVIAEDENGYMKELDAKDVLTIPNKIKSREVVKRGFMSNLLFDNISGIFGAPDALLEILNKITPVKDKKIKSNSEIKVNNVEVDNDGNVKINNEIVINNTNKVLADKKYKEFKISNESDNYISDYVREAVSNFDLDVLKDNFNTKKDENRFNKVLISNIENKITRELESINFDIEIIDKEIERIEKSEEDSKVKEKLKEELIIKKNDIEDKLKIEVPKKLEEAVKESVEELENKKENKKKNETENEVRDHLRGFARTIPSFLMAYGDRNTTLKNFDKVVDDDSFLDLTSITVEEFIRLRDGFTIISDNGEERNVKGLFNEIVFNQSIQEFLNIKEKLSSYYSENQKEDIFNYIPAQRTNQIFTPKKVVKLMLDLLEEEIPEVFNSKDTKFADLYSKSGIYLVEIIKRLNKGIKKDIPNEKERIKWIIENQIYTCAPTNIIYNIVKNYIMSDFEDISSDNIVESDMAYFSQEGKMKEEVERIWGEGMKFDIIIGNPPYQEEDNSRNRNDSLYDSFMENAYKISDVATFITPARFLFNIGSTPSVWNKKMLSDQHFSVLYYEPSSNNIFPGTDIKGGVAITIRDNNRIIGPVDTFTTFSELNSILNKVKSISKLDVFGDIMYVQNKFNLDILYNDYPEFKKILGSNGKERRLTSSIFNQVPEIFNDTSNFEDIKIFGRKDNSRVYMSTKKDYIEDNGNLFKYKVFVPAANGSGAIGEVLSTPLIGEPLIGEPLIGHTQTFISLGSFDNRYEANSLFKYIKTKFARVMLGIKKITQNNKTKETWSKVPLQDFTENSDIDWSLSIPEIDKQLYKKYNLNEKEIKFIEEKVAPME